MKELDVTGLVFTIPARVLRPTEQRQVELLAAIKDRHVLDPAILEERNPFFWDAEVSSSLVDAYYSHMTLDTLGNFRDDARDGVAFLPGHNHRELPFGRSFDALLEDTQEPQRTRVIASFYTMPGLKLNSVTTDDLIDGLRSGILKDTSVGFHSGESVCDLCGRSIWSWDCEHIPGLKYPVGDGDVMRMVVATYAVNGAHLSEVSSVFDGATPRAEVLKAEREAAEGRMRPEAVALIEQRYRVKLPVKRTFAGAEAPGRKATMDLEQQIRELLGLDEKADVVGAVRDMKTSLGLLENANQELGQAKARIKELEPEAAIGVQYRADLITETLKEGVRAYGDKFNNGAYKRMLEGLDLDGIKQMQTDWESIANTRFPGGRITTDGDEQAPGKGRATNGVPAGVYKV